MKSEQLANEMKEEAQSECNSRETEIRQEDNLYDLKSISFHFTVLRHITMIFDIFMKGI